MKTTSAKEKRPAGNRAPSENSGSTSTVSTERRFPLAVPADGGTALTKTWRTGKATWDKFTDKLARPVRSAEKHTGGYVAGALKGTARVKGQVEVRSMLTLDADTPGEHFEMSMDLALDGYAYALHETHSSTPEQPRYRIVVPLAEDLGPDDYTAAVKVLMGRIGVENFDTTCAEPERLMYWPSRPEGANYRLDVVEGKLFDATELLSSAAEEQSSAAGAATVFPAAQIDAEVAWVTERLDELQGLELLDVIEWPGVGEVGWDQGAFLAAQSLVRASNSSAGHLPLDAAEELFTLHAPRAEGTYDPAHKWAEAVKATGESGMPVTPRVSAVEDFAEPEKLDLPTRLSDSILAEQMGRKLGPVLVYVFESKEWRRWDGKRWGLVSSETAREALRAELLAAHAETAPIARTPAELAAVTRLLGHQKANAVLDLMKGLVGRNAVDFDAHPDLLNTPSGVVDLRTGSLAEHRPELYLTKITGAAYVPGAQHDDWEAALQALPEQAREWMRWRFGQALTGHTPDDDVMPVLYGGGSNGKSVQLGAVMAAAGDYAAVVPERLLLSNPGDHPTELMTLKGVRLAVLEEAPEGRRLNVKRLKDVMGTARITARQVHRDNVTFSATHALFISTNYELEVGETDHGTWRRLALVKYPYRYVTGEPDPVQLEKAGDVRLRGRLAAGKRGRAEAVLAWMVSGARDWYRAHQELPPRPEQIVADTRAWRGETDLISQFAEECLTFGLDQEVESTALYAAFTDWLLENGHTSWSQTLFGKRFKAHEMYREHRIGECRKRVKGSYLRVFELVGLTQGAGVRL